MSFNKKYCNWAIIISLLTAYILPSRSSDGFAFKLGYPFSFFTVYNVPIEVGDNIFNSTAFDLAILAVDVLIIYYVLYFINKIISKI